LLLLLIGCTAPATPSDSAMLAHLPANAKTLLLRVMTFNVRRDGREHRTEQRFEQRAAALASVFTRLAPHIAGLQEPFYGQMRQLEALLPTRYTALGRQPATATRRHDFQCAIVYDSEALELLEQAHVTLSQKLHSTSYDNRFTSGLRSLNIARFRLLGDEGSNKKQKQDVIAFNTHLAVDSESARRKQARIVLATVRTWRSRYPAALLILTGDFNAANGQMPHRILTEHDDALYDAWTVAAAASNDGGTKTNGYAHTSHNWLGTTLNTRLGRIVSTVGFALHGSGFALPKRVPRSVAALVRSATQLAKTPRPRFSVWHALPSSLQRMHVDWILYYAPPTSQTQQRSVWMPRLVAVMDTARPAPYSSDHFPVLAVFEQPHDGA
jgi:endonuclease/exonuclease/phosphatase family metal-dependent hydrolase